MTTRAILDPARVQPGAAGAMSKHAETIQEIAQAIAKHPVVVVGMAQNPHVRRARRYLTDAGIAFEYLEYGSYLSEWRRRLAIKMWSGFPTFPQVFVRGDLIGGANQTKAAIDDGSLRTAVGRGGSATAATAATS